MALNIDERSQQLLKTLIECYIREGQPVGSRALARDSGLDVSPATVRNVMTDLEAMGLVVSPHTSAGRVPTSKAYRLFIDSMLSVQALDQHEVQRLKGRLDSKASVEGLMSQASALLSEITHMAGLVMIPRRDVFTFRHIEFLPLSDDRILAVLVTNKSEIQNRVVYSPRRYSAAELQWASNYLNEKFAGETLAAIRRRLLAEMREAKQGLDNLMQEAMTMAEQVLEPETPGQDYVMAGQTNLMEFQELSNVETLRRLFEAFNEKRALLDLLEQCVNGQGVHIFIGEESGYRVLDECSVVTSPYEVEGQVLGVLGVIGPTRMAYDRVIPIVDITARLLGAALNQR